ncbi:hypothetical protein BpHYR1_040769 [Brachionus plicatilis]|uniref:Uncharacterized protein n=1 Tax=Brachionus plicatilis TaxID=10195 RepID=A0A3M7P6P7_BRAPC|nr:hypothetical protein BpHYR1_040769 [Brachionus plicatilis]
MTSRCWIKLRRLDILLIIENKIKKISVFEKAKYLNSYRQFFFLTSDDSEWTLFFFSVVPHLYFGITPQNFSRQQFSSSNIVRSIELSDRTIFGFPNFWL